MGTSRRVTETVVTPVLHSGRSAGTRGPAPSLPPAGHNRRHSPPASWCLHMREHWSPAAARVLHVHLAAHSWSCVKGSRPGGHTCDPTTQEAKAGGPGSSRSDWTKLRRPCLKKRKLGWRHGSSGTVSLSKLKSLSSSLSATKGGKKKSQASSVPAAVTVGSASPFYTRGLFYYVIIHYPYQNIFTQIGIFSKCVTFTI
jgi:hypothetical protein